MLFSSECFEQKEVKIIPLRNIPFEVEIAITKLKRYKSPGSDEIPAELIQTGGQILRFKIHKVINSIWNKEIFW
jgi:hypothetical protein